MNTTKQQYLQAVRGDSAYPVYRAYIGLIALMGYLLAAAIFVGTVFIALRSGGAFFGLITLITGGAIAGLIFLCAKLSKEASLMIADLADAMVEQGSRGR